MKQRRKRFPASQVKIGDCVKAGSPVVYRVVDKNFPNNCDKRWNGLPWFYEFSNRHKSVYLIRVDTGKFAWIYQHNIVMKVNQ